MLVVLRLALGWHFLYEGIWKLTHRDAFVAETEGFLSAARGPAAKLFYGMVPDIEGHKRLEQGLALVEVKEADGKPAKQPRLAEHWEELTRSFVAFYKPTGGSDVNFDLYRQFAAEAERVCQRHIRGLADFVKENGDKIKAHFESLQRFKEAVKSDPSTDFMRQRHWDQMQEYRKEAKGWIADLDAREKALKADLMDLLSKERKREVEAVAVADAKDMKAKQAAAEKANGVDGKQPKAADKKADGKSSDEAGSKLAAAPKRAVEPKPADPPSDLSAAAVSAEKAKKADAASEKQATPPKSETKSVAKADANRKSTAEVTETVVDFGPLAEGHDPAGPFRPSRNPLNWTRIEQLSFLLTYVLLAIGACLMLGLFTRLSALAGAAFMLSVVLSQPSYPGVYPPDLPQMGHALLVNKDFVEMVALLVIASTKLGRWTGLDFILHYCLVRPFCRCCCGCKSKESDHGQ